MEIVEKKKTDKRVLGVRLSRFRELTFLRSIILNFVNIIMIAAIFVILARLQAISAEIQKTRSETFARQASVDFDLLEVEIEAVSGDIAKLESAFLDERGIVAFVGDIEKLRADGILRDFNFLRNDPLVDKTKNNTIPFQLTFEGGVEEVNAALAKFNNLPYLVREQEIAIERNNEQINVIYSGVVYVK